MPTSKKAEMVSRHRTCMLEGASPPNFVSYLPYQIFLQTQRARRMTSSVRAAVKAGRRRGTRAREVQPRHSLKKRRHAVLQEPSPLQLPAPASVATVPGAPVFSSSPSSCSAASTPSSSVGSSSSSPPPASWQLSPLSDVGAALEPPIAAPSDSRSPTAATTTAGSAGSKKKYPCDLCDKSFDYKHVLQNHNRTHTGEKPYQCPQCHKRFTRDHHLKTHIRLHTGEKPFGCAVCHKRFVQVANLRRHERVHAGERLHRCGRGHCDAASSDGDRPTTPDARPFDCVARGAPSRRKRHRDKSGSVSGPDQSSMTSSIATTAFSVAGALGSSAPAPAATVASSINGAGGLHPVLRHDSQLEEHSGDKHSAAEATGSGDGRLTMDVGFRVIRNNRYHQRLLGRRSETWPHAHRLSQPCQEQPEDLSVRK